MRALVAFFLDNLREILRLTAVWNPALTFGHDDSDEPSLVCALSPTKTLVPTLREDGGLAVARGWKHEELAGAATVLACASLVCLRLKAFSGLSPNWHS